MLELKNIKKKYNIEPVLDIPTLLLQKGIYWVKGANGSGKTTFLKLLAALLPFDGDIFLNDVSLKKSPHLYRQQISWAEAEPLYPSYITGKSLIALYRKIRNATLAEVDYLPALFEMTDYLHHPIGSYSAGMSKKLSLVLAFIGNPSLLILDEPLITLDAATLEIVFQQIAEKHRTNGTSFILSSHQSLNENLALAGQCLSVQNQTVVLA